MPPDDADARARDFAIECARLLKDDKCHGVVLLDMRGLSPVTRYAIVGSGTSDRQMNAALVNAKKLGEERGFDPLGMEKDERSTWLLLDFVDVMVHLFEPNARAFYDLEMLWGDASRVAWRRADQAEPEEPGEEQAGAASPAAGTTRAEDRA